MNVIRHHNVFMKFEFPCIAVFEEGGDHEFSNLVTLKKVLLHVRAGGNEVGRHLCRG